MSKKRAQDRMLCEKCHEHPATCHICFGNKGESQDLCETCFAESAPLEMLAGTKELKDAIKNGKCKYCGQPAAEGYGSRSDSDETEFDLMCKECSRDQREFYEMPENDLPTFFSFDDPEALEQRYQQHRELERRLKKYMKQRISERKAKGNG